MCRLQGFGWSVVSIYGTWAEDALYILKCQFQKFKIHQPQTLSSKVKYTYTVPLLAFSFLKLTRQTICKRAQLKYLHIGFPSKWTSVTKLFENSHLEGFSSWITVRSYNQNAVSLWYVNFLISCLLKLLSLIYHSMLGQLQQEGFFVILPTTVVQILTELNFLKCVCAP